MKDYKQFDLFADLNGEKVNELHVEEETMNIISNIKKDSMDEKKTTTLESEERKVEGGQPSCCIALSAIKEKSGVHTYIGGV